MKPKGEQVNCTLGHSDFNNLMGLNSKKLPYIILKHVCYKGFSKGISHFVRACIIRFTKLLCCVINEPKKVILLFDKWAEKPAELQNFSLILNSLKHSEKVTFQKSYLPKTSAKQ
jgi:hypothetical protein